MWTGWTVAMVLCVAQGDVVTETLDEALPDGGRVVREVYRADDGAAIEHGEYQRFHPGGGNAERGVYEHGLRKGRWRGWSEDGELAWKGSYREGVRTGAWAFFHADGTQRAEGRYEDGRRTGSWKAWTPDGASDPVESGTFSAGRIEEASGAVVYEGDLLDGLPHGEWSGRWSNGVTMLEGWMRRGRRHGTFRFFHADGTYDGEMVSGVYLDGRRVGAAPAAADDGLPEGGEGGTAEAPPPSELDSLTARDRVRIDALLASFLADEGTARKRSAEELGRWERGVFPSAVSALRTLDLAADEGHARGRAIVTELLAPLCGGRWFGWRGGDSDEDRATDRLSSLRWASFWELACRRNEVWNLDFALPVAAEERGVPAELLEPAMALDDFAVRTEARPLARRRGEAAAAAREALAWLARHQTAEGLWDAESFPALCPRAADDDEEPPPRCDMPGYPSVEIGVSGLALLAFLESGSSTRAGEHQAVVLRGVRALIGRQHRGGSLWTGTTLHGREMYEHAVATYALALAARSSTSPRLRRAAREAAEFVLQIRNQYGAWRYSVPPQGDNDTSMTSWMARALLAAREAGVGLEAAAVEAAMEGTLAWIDEVTDPATGRVGYDRFGSLSARDAANQHYPPEKGEAMTAAGLLLRLSIGQTAEHTPIVDKHVDLMLKTLPEWDPEGLGCDMTYWSYGTQALAGVGGARWKRWSKAMQATLLESQRQDGDARGSWDPAGPWGYFGGRVYSTALMTLTALELAR